MQDATVRTMCGLQKHQEKNFTRGKFGKQKKGCMNTCEANLVAFTNCIVFNHPVNLPLH